MRSSLVLSLCASVAICAISVQAQLATSSAPRPNPVQPDPNANPCTVTPQTVDTCWRCFQNLLADCDRANPEGIRRQACYAGANNFFTFCLGRTHPGHAGSTVPIVPVGDMNWNTEDGTVYTISTNGTVAFDSIKVYIRFSVNGEPVQREIQSVNIPQKDGTVVISVPAMGLDVGDNGTVGIVTTLVSNQAIVAARADSIAVVDGFDFNHDGVLDQEDLFVAMDRLNTGAMDKDTWNRFLVRYSEGH